VEQNPSAVEQKPAAKQSEAVTPESSNPVIKPVEIAPVPKHVEHAEPKPLERAVSAPWEVVAGPPHLLGKAAPPNREERMAETFAGRSQSCTTAARIEFRAASATQSAP
jgi:hypothetical protein